MDNRKKHGCARGSVTVEAVFVIPIMIFSIFAIIYLSVLLYQNTVTMAEATRSANRIASYWSYIDGYNPPALTDGASASELINKDSYTRRSPYRRWAACGCKTAASTPKRRWRASRLRLTPTAAAHTPR